MQTIVLSAMVVALIAAYPGYRLLHQAFFTSERWWKYVTLLACIVMPFVMATGLFYIPFVVNEGKELTLSTMFTDFIIYAICPAGAIAILGYAADFIADGYRPRRLVIAGAACFSIVMLPTMFYVYGPEVMQRRSIVLTDSDEAGQVSQAATPPSETAPLSDPAPLSGSSGAATGEKSEVTSTEMDRDGLNSDTSSDPSGDVSDG